MLELEDGSGTMHECMVRRQIASENLTGGLRECIRPWLEWSTPGQNGMRCALVPFSKTVVEDFFRFRVLRTPGSTVVPSYLR